MPIRIAVDAMGGDFAPVEVVAGALHAARQDAEAEITLVGDEAAVRAVLQSQGEVPPNIAVRHTSQRVEMGEHPVQATRRKRESSLVVSGLMVADGEADATFTAGNTGAAMAVATLDIGRVAGVDRPALATLIPTARGSALLLDAGANVDCSPRNLLQFALLGSLYAERVLGVPSPRVGLLNIGTEDGKGDALTKEAFPLLRTAPINFQGNVEGKGVFEHTVDVIVCDGFAGNVLIKSGEGMMEMVLEAMQGEIAADPGVVETRDVFDQIFRRVAGRMHYSEFGGAALLGVNGASFVGHGRSNARAITSGIRAAVLAARRGYVQAIREALAGSGGSAA
jgi:glycerol-3-phosphate acyltransferase PlsX